MVVACPACHGRGAVVKEFCDGCRGKGRVPRKRSLAVKIPAGIMEGQAIRVASEGEPPAPEVSQNGEGVRGDLHVLVKVKEHSMYVRDGDHLLLELPIGFTQASLGAEIQVPTLDGPATLTIPRGTQFGSTFRVSGKGLPNLRGGRKGDLITVVKIETPRKLTSKQEKILREFAETEDAAVLPESTGFLKRVADFLAGDKR